jgi:hypothetical protein
VGSNDLQGSGATTATSVSFGGLPTNGETIYVRLWTELNGSSLQADYTYTAAAEAVMISPTQGSRLTDSSQTFTWTAATGATKYDIWLGSTGVGSNNLGGSGGTTTTSYRRNGLPTNGETIYVRLFTFYSGGSGYTDYTYTVHSYAVDVSWDAPSSSTDPVAGYNIYRSQSGTSTYQLINSSVDAQTTYTDTTVQAGQKYDYFVESVDSSGNTSAPSSPVAVTIP